MHSPVGQSGARDVAAQLLQRLALAGAASHGGVQAEPIDVGAQRSLEGSRSCDPGRSQAMHRLAIALPGVYLRVPTFRRPTFWWLQLGHRLHVRGQVRCQQAACRHRQLMAGTRQSGVQVARRKTVIQGGPAGKILSWSRGAGFGRRPSPPTASFAAVQIMPDMAYVKTIVRRVGTYPPAIKVLAW